MRIAIFGDNHFSRSSSILRGDGEKYSLRLENQIKSLNWFERLAEETADMVICLGDFFDKSFIEAEELTALREISWSSLPHLMLVGNHDMGRHDLVYSSSHLFELCNMNVVDKPYSYLDPKEGIEFCFLPYVLEDHRKPLSDYFKAPVTPRIIFSHNDIKGIQMGPIESPIGFTVDEIENNCDLFINGHLHNGMKVSSKIINCGNLTGQNFSEDAFKYEHTALVLDTNTLRVEVYENPHALNFYKLGEVTPADLSKLTFKQNSIVSASATLENLTTIKESLNKLPNVLASRVTLAATALQKNTKDDKNIFEKISTDYLNVFYKFITAEKTNYGPENIVEEELRRIIT